MAGIFKYEIPYYWVHVGPPEMPEPGFYEDPMSLRPYGIKLEKMWRSVGLNWNGEPAIVSNPKSLGEPKPATILLRLDIFHESARIESNGETALLIRGHGDEQSMNGNGEYIQQLYIPRAKCIEATRISPDEWQDFDSDPYDAILAFETDFQSILYLDSEGEAHAWDRQIEEDVRDGRLDAIAEQAVADFDAGRYTEL